MEIKCINCGQTCEVDEEPVPGQHLLCPFCDMKFSYTPQNTSGDNADGISSTAVEPQDEESPANVTTSCPHCGAKYEVGTDYIGETATCETCNNAFVVKEVQEAETSEEPSSDGAMEESSESVPDEAGEKTAVTSGKERFGAFCAKVKATANIAKDKTVSLWRNGWMGRAAIIGFAALLALCSALYFCVGGNRAYETDGEIVYVDGSVATIPYGIKKISKESFTSYDLDKILMIKLPNSVTEINYGVFNGRTNLKAATIPDSVIIISGGAFKDCTGLTDVNIPNGVTEIWSDTFNGCSSLKKIVIPDNVIEIGGCAFEGCKNLATVDLPKCLKKK